MGARECAQQYVSHMPRSSAGEPRLLALTVAPQWQESTVIGVGVRFLLPR